MSRRDRQLELHVTVKSSNTVGASAIELSSLAYCVGGRYAETESDRALLMLYCRDHDSLVIGIP